MSKTKNIGCEVREPLIRKIEQHLEKQGYTLSEFIRESIRKNLKDDDDGK